jgi:hypothetical protein
VLPARSSNHCAIGLFISDNKISCDRPEDVEITVHALNPRGAAITCGPGGMLLRLGVVRRKGATNAFDGTLENRRPHAPQACGGSGA